MGTGAKTGEIAQHLFLSTTRVEHLFAAGILTRGSDLTECRRAYIEHLRRAKAGHRTVTEGGQVLDLTAERARLAKAQAEKVELETAERRGDLIPRGQIEEALFALSSASVLRLRAIAVRAAPECGVAANDAERERIIRTYIDEACNQMAGHLASGNGGGDASGGGGVEEPAAADSQRVGRRRAAAKPRKQRRARAMAD